MQALRSYWLHGFNPKNYGDPELNRLFASGGIFHDSDGAAGVYVTPQLAMTFSAVYDAVNQISNDIAKLPLNLHKRLPNGGSELYTDAKLFRVLKSEPNPEMGSMLFRRQMMVWALTEKGALAEIVRDGMGRVAQLWPIEPNRWRPTRDVARNSRGELVYGPLEYEVDGKTRLPLRDVIYIAGIGPSPHDAYGLIDLARQAVGMALAAQRYGAAFFRNGTQFGGLLLTDQPMNEAQRKAILEAVEAYHKGPRNAGKLGAFGGGFKYFPTTAAPKDAQTKELTDQIINDTARFFNMPLYKLKVALPGAMSYASVELNALEYHRGCLLNWITQWEEELNRKCIPTLEARQQFIKHNADAFLRGDTASRAAFYTAMRNLGAITVNEIRDKEDLNPIGPQGDIYLIQQGYVPMDRLNELVDAQIAKASGADDEPTPDDPNDTPALDGEDVRRVLQRAEVAETIAREAEREAAELRTKIAALEASGSKDAETITALRTSEHEAITRAAMATQVAEQERSKASAADAQRDEAMRASDDARQKADAATVRAEEAARDKAEADRRVAEAIATSAALRTEADAAAARLAAKEAELAEAVTGRAELTRVVEAERVRAGAAEERALAAELAQNGLADAAFLAAEREQDAQRTATAAKAEAARLAAERDAALAARGAAEARALAADADRADAVLSADRAQALAESARLAEAEVAGQLAAVKGEREAAAMALRATEEAMQAARREAEQATASRVDADQRLAAARQAESAAVDALAAVQAERDSALTVQGQMAERLATAEAELDSATRTAEEARQAAQESAGVVSQREATIASLEERVAALEAVEARSQQQSDALESAKQQLDSANQALSQAKSAQAHAETREAEAKSAQQAAETRQTALIAAETERQREARRAAAARQAAVIASHRWLVVDALGRMARREAQQARQRQTTPEKLRRWIASLRTMHEPVCVEALLPAMRTCLAWRGSTDDAGEATAQLVRAHLDTFEVEIGKALSADPEDFHAVLETILTRWETEHAETVADRLMAEELRHVQTL